MHHLTEPLFIHTLTSVSSSFWISLPALFSITNPIGLALIFYQITEGRDEQERHQLAKQIAINAFVILVCTAFFGELILEFFGITIDAVRIAGGLVVAVGAWHLLNSSEQRSNSKQKEAEQGGQTVAMPNGMDSAFFPLTLPFTIGPGCLAVIIALTSVRPIDHKGVLGFYCGLLLAIITLCLIILVSYRYCDKIIDVLGKSKANIVSRFSALILLCIGVQILATGVQGFLIPILHK